MNRPTTDALAAPSAAPRQATARIAAPTPFVKPSPGSWDLDASHCERPLPRFMRGLFEDGLTSGNRASAEDYGALLDTVEAATVNGFLYICVRPLGAPPEPKRSPPKLLLKLIMFLHPGIRRRLRAATAAFATRRWREDTRRYLEELVPAIEARAEALRAVAVATLDDAALADHIAQTRALILDDLRVHYGTNLARVIPVGDLIAHVRSWIDVPAQDVLATLRGFSPSSTEGLAELTTLAERVRADPDLLARVVAGDDPEAIVAELESRQDPIGAAARAWLDRVGHRVTGFSPGYPSLRESPITLLGALRSTVAGHHLDDALAAGRAAGDRLRARIPEAHRDTYESLLEEARFVYFLRDHCTMRDTALFGLLRRGLLELGRRLVDRGLLDDPEAGLDLAADEVQAVLLGGGEVDFDEVKRWHLWRRHATSEIAPELLGPTPEPPPPVEWLPPVQARMVRALDAYVDAMFGERAAPAPAAPDAGPAPPARVVEGLSASPGKREGIARLVLAPGDFDRVEPGDVLVARITTPAYNVLLPMLAGVVTDRGGILSHPAIVSREYGIPGVVGTRVGTATIPDGARVEIDGDAGTVRILS